MKFTKGKAIAATVGEIVTLASLFGVAVSDNEISGTESAGLLSAAITGVVTIFAVWKTRNLPISES